MKLGRLKEIDIRKVFPHEQYDFSAWLAKEENIDELGNTLNLSLSDVETEKFVDNYRCDILCKDEITGKKLKYSSEHNEVNWNAVDDSGVYAKADLISMNN